MTGLTEVTGVAGVTREVEKEVTGVTGVMGATGVTREEEKGSTRCPRGPKKGIMVHCTWNNISLSDKDCPSHLIP